MNDDQVITLSYSIKESELEEEVSRIYDKALKKIFSMGRDVPELPDHTLTYQTLDSIQSIGQELSEIRRLLSNVENIVTQFLEHKSGAFAQPAREPQIVETNHEETDMDALSKISSPFEQQRRLAKELQKHESPTKGHKQ